MTQEQVDKLGYNNSTTQQLNNSTDFDKLGYNNSTTQRLNNSTGFMIQCPDCRAKIPDDSAFCDQCGVELYWCPECKRPKLRRGHDCPLCGSDLVPGRQYLVSQQSSNQAIKQSSNQAIRQSSNQALSLVGNGWTLPLREGQFGRTSGIYPEFASCKYISGNHGKFILSASGWLVVDNGSTNGISVNGTELTPGVAVPLHAGDKLIIATIEFEVKSLSSNH